MSVGSPFMKTIPQGAATSIFVATAPELDGIGGKFFENCNESVPKPWATNTRYAKKLWTVTEELIKNAPRPDRAEREIHAVQEEEHKHEDDHEEHEEVKLSDTPEPKFEHPHSDDDEKKSSSSSDSD